jgi:hypothetical protein
MSASLPERNSPEIHLAVATPEEIIALQHANSEEWRGALDLPAYLRREEVLAEQTLTKDGGLTAWALVYQPAGSDEKDRQVLCGCETIKKRAFYAGPNWVEPVTAHGICSVFCPPKHRGKGYAGRMMADLGDKLKTWQSNGQNNLFSVLYSDIGKVRRQSIVSPFFNRTFAHRRVGVLRRTRMEGFPVIPYFSQCSGRNALRSSRRAVAEVP